MPLSQPKPETERHGLLEMIPGKDILKVCCEFDYGCNPGSVRDSRTRVHSWQSKLGLPDFLSYKSTLLGGLDTLRPDKVIDLYLGDAVSFGDGGGRNQLEATYVPPAGAKFTIAFVTTNAGINSAQAGLFSVNDQKWINIQNYLGLQVLDGNSNTEAVTSAIYTNAPSAAPISSTKAHLIQIEVSPHAALSASGAWLNGVSFAGTFTTWPDIAPIDYIRIGGGQWKHKGIYIFEGAVNPTDLFEWMKAHYPHLTF